MRVNLSFTDPASDDVVQYHCLQVRSSMEEETDPYEILTYCLAENPSNWKIQANQFDQKFTFAQLYEQNLTSEQLYHWSAPIDVAERYQWYFNQRFLSQDVSSMTSELFYNCSSTRFGPSCEYSFDIHQSPHASLKEILDDFYKTEYEPRTLTCYEHLVCDRGSSLAYLDWSEICDGYVDCLTDEIDERNCWQLEMNECAKDEYRCSNGQCIAKMFFRDHRDVCECLDRSDGSQLSKSLFE